MKTLGPLLFAALIAFFWGGTTFLMGASAWAPVGLAGGVAYGLGYFAGRKRLWEPS